ncbi:hypothetical protein EWM64_g7035 [Hericium alpestre]|uniref:Aminoglycoside phosphotransferase domain-containing protein n=1 Tax=Hericium alpestre TaxID=135208 RepID=A0A4Y9ZU07_9AGAM|nr:hypothetical protein EWM64_g7035 [Hericium alpestre]
MTLDTARKIATSTSLIHTKRDLIPRDYSERHISYLSSKYELSLKFNIDCLSVSLTTGEGIEDVLAFIGTSVTNLSAGRQPGASPPSGTFWSYLLDCIAACFVLPTPTVPADVSSELASLATDSDILKLMNNPLDSAWGESLKRRLGVEDALYVTVNRITPSLVVKRPMLSERASLDFVRKNTSIPIPHDLCPHLPYLVMHFVDGEMLYESWDKLSRFMQFRIACTLRLYTKQLRSLTGPAPGALVDGRVNGAVFDENVYGPFTDAQSFRRFCEFVAFCGWKTRVLGAVGDGKAIPPLACPDLIWTPVFTHGDLNLSNIMLDRRGGLWIMDWANAGFYPPTMESIAMRQIDEIVHAEDVPPSWRRYRSFIAGETSREEEEFWGNFTGGVFRFPTSQRYM